MLQDENLQSAPGTRVGTTAYLAPEVIVNTQGHKYDGKVLLYPQAGCCQLCAVVC